MDNGYMGAPSTQIEQQEMMGDDMMDTNNFGHDLHQDWDYNA